MVYSRDGHGSGAKRLGVRIHFSDSDPDLSFREKSGSGFGMYGIVMVYVECKVHVCTVNGSIMQRIYHI